MASAVETTEGTYELDKTHSSVQFAVRHAGVASFRASFGEIDARLVLENGRAELTASAVVASISIADPPEFREHVVRGGDFFAADAHPQLTFRSTGIKIHDHGRAIVLGELGIRGVSNPVSATGTFTAPTVDPYGNTRVGLELEATIDRRTWGMNWQMPLPDGGEALDWHVTVSAHLELMKMP